jgi:hypothetical protein
MGGLNIYLFYHGLALYADILRYMNSQNKLWRCRSVDIPIYAYFTTSLNPKRLKDVILELHIYIPIKFKCQLSFNWGLCIPVQMFFFFFQIERTLSTNFKIKNVRFVSANFYNSPSSLFCVLVTAKISNV